ncbi:ABC transporter substrate-binding protein [Peribacillus sp. NPDC097206]|uniref:ABC transporter substrate-binding protein n=1 Tax=unclassified Peribacillus TaxID=2675266 RepID=UPI00382D3122
MLLGIAMLLLFIAGCSGGNAEKTLGITEESIKIGAWLPMTGPAAVYGSTQRQGIEAYFEMINEDGGVNGRKIEYITEDSGRDPQQTVAAARKLIERDEVFAIVAPFGTAQTEATFSFVLDEKKVPLLNVYGGLENWYDPSRENLYGVMIPYEDQARALGRWAAKEGAKNILVIHNDPAVYEIVANNVEPGVKTVESSLSVDLLPVKYGTADYAPIALEVINRKPDAIVMIQPIEELIALAKALDNQNFEVPLYTYSPNASLDTLELGGGAVEGLHAMSWTVPPTTNSPAVKEYREVLKKHAPATTPDFQSLFTWAESKIFVEALKKIDGAPTREKLISALESIENYETDILPPVSFSSDNHLGVKEIQPVKVENGEWKTVGGFIDPATDW